MYFMEMMEKRIRVRFSEWSDDYGFVNNEESIRIQTMLQIARFLIDLLLCFTKRAFQCPFPVHHLQPLPAQYTLLDSDKWRRRKPVFPGRLSLQEECDWNSLVKITETKDIFR